MSGQGKVTKNDPEAGTRLGHRGLIALAALACASALVFTLGWGAVERGSIRGSGTVIVENRPLGSFERISLGDLGTLIISQGDEEALTVETDDNLMYYIQSRVRAGTLVLGLHHGANRRGVEPSNGITYRLSVRHVAGLEVADSGRIQAQALDVDHLEITAQDSGGVEVAFLTAGTLGSWVEDSARVCLAGRVENQEITVQDSGRYLAGRLQSRTAAASASDSSEVTLWATEALDVTVTDSGRVRYYGEPRRAQRLSDDGTLAGLGEP